MIGSARLAGMVAGAVIAALAPAVTGDDVRGAHGGGLAAREGEGEPGAYGPLLGARVQPHTPERIPLDAVTPSSERFDALLMDRATNEVHPIDPRLLAMLRTLAQRHAPALARIEIVSGYRSPKLNEMLRKKGHHVASHSQHSLGHAVDFRLVERDAEKGIDPRAIEAELRELGWDGGIGSYRTKDDWFVHMDTGPNRRWDGY